MVLAGSAGRVLDIAYLYTRYLLKRSSEYIFQFGKTTKTLTRARQRKPMKFYPFRENANFCVCHHIDLYLDKMKEFHKIEEQLLLNFLNLIKGLQIKLSPDEF